METFVISLWVVVIALFASPFFGISQKDIHTNIVTAYILGLFAFIVTLSWKLYQLFNHFHPFG